ncbi:hypothetical protein NEMIN01_0267 [Nematocida minor]|uniref:uncharacterized protein n=1 Tax=Nematocida minor TaxID=1912983 RepID=UPI00221F6B5E|nr:uncharacterized protein NEMIN01_0267 [Nematocida minor]KAI5189101.1 hypothetical protein NEMIN01_0267 [Nematocida minor]
MKLFLVLLFQSLFISCYYYTDGWRGNRYHSYTSSIPSYHAVHRYTQSRIIHPYGSYYNHPYSTPYGTAYNTGYDYYNGEYAAPYPYPNYLA